MAENTLAVGGFGVYYTSGVIAKLSFVLIAVFGKEVSSVSRKSVSPFTNPACAEKPPRVSLFLSPPCVFDGTTLLDLTLKIDFGLEETTS